MVCKGYGNVEHMGATSDQQQGRGITRAEHEKFGLGTRVKMWRSSRTYGTPLSLVQRNDSHSVASTYHKCVE